MMKSLTVLSAVLAAMALSGCGNSGINCNSATDFACVESTWPGVMAPAPTCTGTYTTVTACATGQINTCTFTDSTTYPSPVTSVIKYYTGANVTAGQAFCTSRSGTWQ